MPSGGLLLNFPCLAAEKKGGILFLLANGVGETAARADKDVPHLPMVMMLKWDVSPGRPQISETQSTLLNDFKAAF